MAGLFEGSESGNEVLKNEFDFYVLHSRKPVLVMFTADWCDACKRVSPVVRRVSSNLDGKAMIYQVDVDKHPEVAKRFGISAIPTLMIFNKGKVAERIRTAEEPAIRERLLRYVE